MQPSPVVRRWNAWVSVLSAAMLVAFRCEPRVASLSFPCPGVCVCTVSPSDTSRCTRTTAGAVGQRPAAFTDLADCLRRSLCTVPVCSSRRACKFCPRLQVRCQGPLAAGQVAELPCHTAETFGSPTYPEHAGGRCDEDLRRARFGARWLAQLPTAREGKKSSILVTHSPGQSRAVYGRGSAVPNLGQTPIGQPTLRDGSRLRSWPRRALGPC
jgi:hypothetical protein